MVAMKVEYSAVMQADRLVECLVALSVENSVACSAECWDHKIVEWKAELSVEMKAAKRDA